MEKPTLNPYRLDTELTGYMPVPRALLGMDLPSTAILIYGALVDRGTLSRKNHYADEHDRVYVIYTLEGLANTLHISDTAVKRHLRELEAAGLIYRHRQKRCSPSQIFLNLPADSIRGTSEGTDSPTQGAKMSPPTGRKVPSNNRKEQPDYSNRYQHREEESL